jgi:hypothetical protein
MQQYYDLFYSGNYQPDTFIECDPGYLNCVKNTIIKTKYTKTTWT